ncbi:MAG: hypothetical protein JXR53_13170 [Bacteroidales bacterium]|nr:hypothetical protein [Bacteroidales bacterium]
MKTLITTMFMILLGIMVIAQPSDGTIKAKIQADSPSATNIELLGSGTTSREYTDGAYYNYYRRSYRTTKPTTYTGISEVYSGSIQYVQSSGSYVFSQYLIGDHWFIGVPDPDKNEILTMLNADLEKYLKNVYYNRVVGELSPISFPADPEYHWHELTSVSFLTKVTYSEKINSTQLRKAEHTYRVRIYSDEFKGAWKSFNSSREEEDKNAGEVLTYTKDEIDNMPTLADLDAENRAAAIMASLPSVADAPTFQSSAQLFYYIHDIILNKDVNEVKAHIYKVLAPACFKNNSTVLLNNYDQEWLDKLTNNHEAFKSCYCQYPTVQSESKAGITFYDRNNKRMLRYVGIEDNGTWKLTLISFYPASTSEQEELKSMNENCQEKPDLTVREVLSYKVGDDVTGIFSNGEYNATIDKLDPNISTRYFIKLVGDNSGKGYWMEEVSLKKGHVGTNINGGSSSSSSSESKSSSSFKVGDDVYVNTTKGKMKATIKEISGEKALVDFKNPMYDDTWVTLTNCSFEK